MGSISEQTYECLSINFDIFPNFGHKANADCLAAMNRHDRATPVRVLHNYMTPPLSHNLETDFPQRPDYMGTCYPWHSGHTDIL